MSNLYPPLLCSDSEATIQSKRPKRTQLITTKRFSVYVPYRKRSVRYSAITEKLGDFSKAHPIETDVFSPNNIGSSCSRLLYGVSVPIHNILTYDLIQLSDGLIIL